MAAGCTSQRTLSVMQSFKTHSRSVVLLDPPWLTVEHRDIEFPDGTHVPSWPFVITPAYINLMAETTDGLFICFRQVKYAYDGESLAVVGGYIEPGEAPLAAAKRELLEETGYSATEWISFGEHVPDANRGCGMAHLFFARNAHKISEPTEIDREQPIQVLLTREQVQAALFGNQFKVLAWSAVAALTLAYHSPSS